MLRGSENKAEDNNDVDIIPLVHIVPYLLQTGGHTYAEGKITGISLHEDGSILKPLMPPPRGERELEFYRTVFEDDAPRISLNLRSFVPQFLGSFQAFVSDQIVTFLKLENLTSKFSKPCIMDVKIGFRTYDPESTPEKIERAQKKYLTTSKLGFCIPGIKVYDPVSGKYTEYDKIYGKSLTVNNIKNALICYLGGHDKLNAKTLQSFLQRLHAIQKWFTSQENLAFFSSSLLLIYDGDPLPSRNDAGEKRNERAIVNSNDADQTACNAERHGVLTDVRMIDFAHVFPSQELDSNYLRGLNNFIDMLSEIANEFAQR